jgi:hypothetical protein
MMYAVEPPEKRDFMVQEVPDIEHEIHKDNSRKNPDPKGKIKDVQNA